MPVAVPDSRANRRFVRVPMVCVVFVLMLVIHRLVRMSMNVTLGEMQPHACGHDNRCRAQSPRERFVKDEHR
jgi:hypothetical protein